MNRHPVLAVVLAAAAVAAGCQKGPRATRIGFVLATMQEERYQKDRRYFEEAAAKLGAQVLFEDSANDERVQLQKVENLLTKGVAALVVQPTNSASAATIVASAHASKVPVVAYDRMIDNAPVDYYVTQDSFRVGVLQAEAAVVATRGVGNYVILVGQAGHSVANEITAGNRSVLGLHPEIKVVVEQTHAAWSPEQALATTENALTRFKNDLQAILANNSGMIRGAIQALREQNLAGKVFTAGADADLPNCQYVAKGLQSLDVLKGIQPLAEAAARTAVLLARGETPPHDRTTASGSHQVKTVVTPVTAFDRTNLDEVIIRSGFHLREDVYR